MDSLSLKGRKYFLTPVCLVPNGRAHLGHIAGPLLKMDVLRRHVLRGGGEATMISVSDVHESHVLVRAHQDGTTPVEVANANHHLIRRDLDALDIAYDDLLNPLDEAWARQYEEVNRDFLTGIVEAGNAKARTELMPVLDAEKTASPGSPFRPRVGEAVVSGWLKGECPHCGASLVGFFCESCGGHFSPAQMVDPATAHFEGKLRLDEVTSLHLDVPGGAEHLRSALDGICRRPDFLAIADRYLRANGATIRLTVPSRWGIRWDDEALSPGQVIFSYSALLIGCHLVAGERYKEITGSGLNPFARDSQVRTVISFGIDNAVPFLVGAVGCGLAQETYKPVDSLLVNYFYDLEGSKFSTSRGHVIWGGDIVTVGQAEPDLTRAYLCHRNPEFTRSTFKADEFLHFHNDYAARINAAVRDAVGALGSDAVPTSPPVMRALLRALVSQGDALDPDTFHLKAAWGVVEDWLDRAPATTSTPEAAATWLLGLAQLAAPVMPRLAQQLWQAAGQTRPLDVASLTGGDLRVTLTGVPPHLRSLARAQFEACLPPSQPK